MAYREGVLCFIEISSPLGFRGSLPFGARMASFPPKESSFKNFNGGVSLVECSHYLMLFSIFDLLPRDRSNLLFGTYFENGVSGEVLCFIAISSPLGNHGGLKICAC